MNNNILINLKSQKYFDTIRIPDIEIKCFIRKKRDNIYETFEIP